MYELHIGWRYKDTSGTHIEKHEKDWDIDATDSEWIKGLKFQWFEGNYSCDCNRSIFIFPDECAVEDDTEFPCGEEIIFDKVAFWRNGHLIGTCSDAEYEAIIDRRWWDKLKPIEITEPTTYTLTITGQDGTMHSSKITLVPEEGKDVKLQNN